MSAQWSEPDSVVDRRQTGLEASNAGTTPELRAEVNEPGDGLFRGRIRGGRSRRWLRWAASVAVLTLLVAPLVVWWQYQSAYVTSRHAVVRGDLAEIGTRIEGVLAQRLVEVGQRVKAGQVLGRLQDRHLRADVLQAQARLGVLHRELAAEERDIAHQRRLLGNERDRAAAKWEEARADVDAARAQAEQAAAHHEARLALLTLKAIPREQVQDAARQASAARAQLTAAQARLRAADSDQRTADIDLDGVSLRQRRIEVLRATVTEARARLQRTQAELDSTLLRAPAAGSVTRWMVHPGGAVEAGDSVVSMLLGTEQWIEAWVDEDRVGALHAGIPATVTVPSLPGRELKGVVEQIGLITDFELPDSAVPQPRFSRMRGTPLIAVRIRLREAEPRLRPGMSATAAIRVEGAGVL